MWTTGLHPIREHVECTCDNKKKSTSRYFDVYLYDGSLLKSWFDDEVHSTECRVLAFICNGGESKASKKMWINPMCHA